MINKRRIFFPVIFVFLFISMVGVWIFQDLHMFNNDIALISKNGNLMEVRGGCLNKQAPCVVNYMMMNSSSTASTKKKTIFYMGDLWEGMEEFLRFGNCEYSNCVMQTSDNPEHLALADAVIFAQNSQYISRKVPPRIRQQQLWFVYGVESPATPGYKWNSAINDFNGTLSYLQSAVPFSIPYGLTFKVDSNSTYSQINYARGKTKGAYVYVSNCNTKQYDRLDSMKQLSKYLDVDVFGGCTGKKPCPTRFDTECMAKLHSQYRFYLAFENSLCTEYITEKFWRTFESDKYFLPVAMGGLSVKEYSDIAPPDSFIHAYNFTSIADLGKYLKHLMTDDAAYNRYHQWRQHYTTKRMAAIPTVCNFCKIINNPEMLASTRNRRFADEWNSQENCKDISKIMP